MNPAIDLNSMTATPQAQQRPKAPKGYAYVDAQDVDWSKHPDMRSAYTPKARDRANIVSCATECGSYAISAAPAIEVTSQDGQLHGVTGRGRFGAMRAYNKANKEGEPTLLLLARIIAPEHASIRHTDENGCTRVASNAWKASRVHSEYYEMVEGGMAAKDAKGVLAKRLGCSTKNIAYFLLVAEWLSKEALEALDSDDDVARRQFTTVRKRLTSYVGAMRTRLKVSKTSPFRVTDLLDDEMRTKWYDRTDKLVDDLIASAKKPGKKGDPSTTITRADIRKFANAISNPSEEQKALVSAAGFTPKQADILLAMIGDKALFLGAPGDPMTQHLGDVAASEASRLLFKSACGEQAKALESESE